MALQVGRPIESGKGQATWFWILTAVHRFQDGTETR